MKSSRVLAVALVGSVAIPAALYSPFLRPLPISSSDALVRVWRVDDGDRFRDFSHAQFEVLEARAESSFDAVGGISFWRRTLRDGERSVSVTLGLVTPGFFDVFDVEPILGRHLTPEELQGGARHIALNERFWSAFFGSDPDIVGRRVTMRGRTHTVVGVLPDELRTPSRSMVWGAYPRGEPAARNQMIVMGRVTRGAARDAGAEVTELSAWHEPLSRARARHGWSSVLLVSSVMVTIVLAAWLTLGRRFSIQSMA